MDSPFGLWTKCDLYPPPPSLGPGSPVFIHSDKNLRLLARFREGQFVAGHKLTVDADGRGLAGPVAIAPRQKSGLVQQDRLAQPLT